MRLFGQYPFVTVTGPRQSGKTTLCRSVFDHLDYANLEAPHVREFAEADPLSFLERYNQGAVLDEVHRVPDLLSYLQVLADEEGRNGLFVLTGSEQFGLTNAVSQSLAGRTAMLRLLPFTLAERRAVGGGEGIDEILYSGGYPRIHDQRLDPTEALADYWATYVERDVRRIGAIRNLEAFRRFATLCAGRVGQLLNVTQLAADTGVTQPTASEWLAVLEASDILFRLQPYATNLRKRVTRSPKLYFNDVGLASYLIGIRSPDQIAAHPLRGPLFENAAISEAVKHRFNNSERRIDLMFFRDRRGLEVDLLYPTPRGLAAIEIKSGRTIASDWFGPPRRLAEALPQITDQAVVYGGDEPQKRGETTAVPLAGFADLLAGYDTQPSAGESGAPVPPRP